MFFTEQRSILTKSDLSSLSFVNCAFGNVSKHKPTVTLHFVHHLWELYKNIVGLECSSVPKMCKALGQKTFYGLHLRSVIHSDLILGKVIRTVFQSILVAHECQFIPASLVKKTPFAIEWSFPWCLCEGFFLSYMINGFSQDYYHF
jgi:hypothetical protein